MQRSSRACNDAWLLASQGALRCILALVSLTLVASGCGDDRPGHTSAPLQGSPVATPGQAAPAPRVDIAALVEASHYAVHNVPRGDKLNVRDEPTPDATIVAALEPGAPPVLWTGIASRSSKSEWWRIATGNVEGWVNAAFLAPARARPDPRAHLFCSGTEPFWSLRIAADGKSACGETCEAPAGLVSNVERQAGERWLVSSTTSQGERFFSGTISRKACSDNMSDTRYSLAVELRGSKSSYAGCCNLALIAR